MTTLYSNRLHGFALACVSVLLAIAIAKPAFAGEVQLSVDSKSTYVGVPVTLSIIINDATEYERPEVPDIPGVTVEASRGSRTSSSVTVINGRMTQTKSETLVFTFTPSQPGTFIIPAFPVIVDGKTYDTEPIEITVNKSESGDLLFAEIVANRTKIYLGQPLQLTLRIWALPYEDQQYRVKLSGDDMWMMLDREKTQWGPFGEAVTKLRNQFGNFDSHPREVQRESADGTAKTYYLYAIPINVWPEQVGQLTVPAVRLVMMYPQRLARQFGMNLTVAQSRPLSIAPEMPAVEVVNPPEQGRPPTWAGLVGKFDFSVSAKPTDVAVGDPITLTLTIRDRSSGARMDVLPPPPLERVARLTDDFKIPNEPLAGTVNQRSKTFTQTIRAKNDQVNRIPAIPLTYFDPDAEKYVTIHSEPIPLAVKAGSKMMLSDVVASSGNSNAASSTTDLTENSGGLLANYSDAETLLIDQRFVPGWSLVATLLAAPLVVAGVWLTRLLRDRSPRAAAASRRRSAAKRAVGALRQLGERHPSTSSGPVASILGTFVSDRFEAPPGTRTADEVRRHLLVHGIVAADAELAHSVLSECEQTAYAGDSCADLHGLVERAVRCVQHLDRSRAR